MNKTLIIKPRGFQKGNKLGVSNKGRKNKPNQGFQKGNKLFQHPKSISTRFKKGRVATPEERAKQVNSLRGEKHYLWNGGSELKARIRGSYKYRQWRCDVFQRDNYTCQSCGARGCYLEADHNPKMFSEIIREYTIRSLEEADACEELWNINNGRTLCRPCHDKTKIWWKKK